MTVGSSGAERLPRAAGKPGPEAPRLRKSSVSASPSAELPEVLLLMSVRPAPVTVQLCHDVVSLCRVLYAPDTSILKLV